MVFGSDEQLQKEFKEISSRQVNVTNTRKEMQALQRNAYGMKDPVVFLANVFGCGVDLSFGKNPKVVILCED